MMSNKDFIKTIFGKRIYRWESCRVEDEIIKFHDDGDLAKHYFIGEIGEYYSHLCDDRDSHRFIFPDKTSIEITDENRMRLKQDHPEGPWFEVDNNFLRDRRKYD